MKYFGLLLLLIIILSCNESKIQKKELITKSVIDTVKVKSHSIVNIPHCPRPVKKPNDPLYFLIVDSPPKFPNTLKNLSKEKLQQKIKNEISKIVKANFRPNQSHLDLNGVQRIYSQFKIDSLGFIKDIQIRAPHPWYKKETKRAIKLIPKLIPANHNGKNVSIIYNLPIIFKVED